MIKTIIGKRGKGKTTLAKNLIRAEKADQVFILDFLGEYQHLERKNIFVLREEISIFYNRVKAQSGKEKKTLVIFDEIDLYGKKSIPIEYLYRYGRHADVDIIAISRRFYDLPVIVRSLTDWFYLFQITEERDLNYLRWLVPKDVITKIMKLKDFDYIIIKL